MGELTLDAYLQERVPQIEEQLKVVVPTTVTKDWVRNAAGAERNAIDLGPVQHHSDMVYHLLGAGGKRLRPVLTCLTHQALGGKRDDIVLFSTIPELIHNGTLIHDDICDESGERRGKPAVHTLNHEGVDGAIIDANLLYCHWWPLVDSSDLPDSKKLDITRLVLREFLKVNIGQKMDTSWSRRMRTGHLGLAKVVVPLEEYKQMCAYKTGALMTTAVNLGALLARKETDAVLLDALQYVATNAGIAFQIRDDMLNLDAEAEYQKGKVFGEDITGGKLSYMVVYTLNSERISVKDRKMLRRILTSKTKSARKKKQAIAIMDASGAMTQARQYQSWLISDAHVRLDLALPDSQYRSVFHELLDYAIKRDK